MTPTPQAVIATAAGVMCLAAAGRNIAREWNWRRELSLNAVSFLWLGVAYFVGVSALVAAYATHSVDNYSVRTSLVAFAAVSVGVVGMTTATQSWVGFITPRRASVEFTELTRSEWYWVCCLLITLAIISRTLAFGKDVVFGALTTDLPRTWGNYIDR